MKLYLSIVLFSIGIMFSAKSQEVFRETAEGLRMNMITDAPGETARIGDLTSVHMIAEAVTGFEIKNTYKEKGGKELFIPVKIPTFPGDLYHALTVMSPGDSARFAITADSLYMKIFRKPLPDQVPLGSDVIFTIKMFDVLTPEEQVIRQDSLRNAVYNQRNEAMEKREDEMIKNYLTREGLEAEKTESGIYYITDNEIKSVADSGKTVVLNYKTSLLDGTVVEDSRDIGRPFTFVIGQHAVIPGWEEAVMLMDEGGLLKAIIPSRLAFRHLSPGRIPPNSILVMDIELLSVK